MALMTTDSLIAILAAANALVTILTTTVQTMSMEYLRRKYPSIRPPPLNQARFRDAKTLRINEYGNTDPVPDGRHGRPRYDSLEPDHRDPFPRQRDDPKRGGR